MRAGVCHKGVIPDFLESSGPEGTCLPGRDLPSRPLHGCSVGHSTRGSRAHLIPVPLRRRGSRRPGLRRHDRAGLSRRAGAAGDHRSDPQQPDPLVLMSGARHAGLFLDMLAAERGASRNTLDAYRRDLDDYLAYLDEAGSRPDAAAAATIRGFMASLEERGLKASSAARRLSAVRQFHRFLYVEGYAPADPTAAVSAPKRGRALPKVLSVTPVARLLQVAYEGIEHPEASAPERLRAARMACLLELLYA